MPTYKTNITLFGWDNADRLFPGAKEAFAALHPTDTEWEFRWSRPTLKADCIDGIFAYKKGDSLADPYLYFKGVWKRL